MKDRDGHIPYLMSLTRRVVGEQMRKRNEEMSEHDEAVLAATPETVRKAGSITLSRMPALPARLATSATKRRLFFCPVFSLCSAS